MGDIWDDPDPGGGDVLTSPAQTSALPVTSVWAEGKKSTDDVKLKTFEEIINDATIIETFLRLDYKRILMIVTLQWNLLI